MLINFSLGTPSILKQSKNNTYAKLTQIKTAYLKAKNSYIIVPKSKERKFKYIDSTLNYANFIMRATFLKPKSKYPIALSLYRELLRFNPCHKEAKYNRDLIIGIYKDMGRSVP